METDRDSMRQTEAVTHREILRQRQPATDKRPQRI